MVRVRPAVAATMHAGYGDDLRGWDYPAAAPRASSVPRGAGAGPGPRDGRAGPMIMLRAGAAFLLYLCLAAAAVAWAPVVA